MYNFSLVLWEIFVPKSVFFSEYIGHTTNAGVIFEINIILTGLDLKPNYSLFYAVYYLTKVPFLFVYVMMQVTDYHSPIAFHVKLNRR